MPPSFNTLNLILRAVSFPCLSCRLCRLWLESVQGVRVEIPSLWAIVFQVFSIIQGKVMAIGQAIFVIFAHEPGPHICIDRMTW